MLESKRKCLECGGGSISESRQMTSNCLRWMITGVILYQDHLIYRLSLYGSFSPNHVLVVFSVPTITTSPLHISCVFPKIHNRDAMLRLLIEMTWQPTMKPFSNSPKRKIFISSCSSNRNPQGILRKFGQIVIMFGVVTCIIGIKVVPAKIMVLDTF